MKKCQIIVPLVVEQCGTQQKRERLATTFKDNNSLSLYATRASFTTKIYALYLIKLDTLPHKLLIKLIQVKRHDCSLLQIYGIIVHVAGRPCGKKEQHRY